MRIREIMAAIVVLAGTARADDPVDYPRQIKPVLQARCYACHGVLKQKGGLRLDTAALAIRGGSEPAVAPGDADASPLLHRVSAEPGVPDRMPPEGEPLKPAEIEAIRRWIAQGAKAPPDETPERDPRDHWAFRTPIRPPVPAVEQREWVKNPIDAFIADRHEKRGLTPQKPADKRVWLRRVSIDLTGLPPTRNEQDAFLADSSEDAFDRVVSRLLDSPQYGERWGRHWMDIWRYSDWWGLGAEVRNSQKHIWHWRDWIIESINQDKGYDQMLREMLAADELYPDDLDKLRASGFLARQYFKFNRTTWLDETIEHTSKAMLGLTMNCAKCHDHKYDPFSQVEYYQMRSIFEPYQIRTDMVPGELDVETDGLPRAFDCNPDARTFLHIRGDERRPDEARVIKPAFPAFLTPVAPRIEPVILTIEAYQPGLRPFVLQAHLKAADHRIAEARKALEVTSGGPAEIRRAEDALTSAEADRASIEARAAADRACHHQPPPDQISALVAEAARLQKVAAVAKAGAEASRARFELLGADPKHKDAAVKKVEATRLALEALQKASAAPGQSYTPLPGSLKTLESNLEAETSRNKPYPRVSTGRRAALARWITDPRHPLPARVAVNHLWARHFGRPLVPTVFDFGRKGTPPTHPELLDWLAVEFVEHGWSMKHLHRLIVTSNTYQMASSGAGASDRNRTIDPENTQYWRMNPIRMESEVVRDSLLHLSGDLNLTQGGPPIPVADESSKRRSLYFVHSHNEHQKFLSSFDDANVLDCYRRADSIVPQQALALENSALATSSAEKIARRLRAAHPDATDLEFVRDAFLTVLAVEPSDAEQAVVLDGFARLAEVSRQAGRPDPSSRARMALILALLNHNDFVTVR